jgi:hypothetical protein
MIIKKKKRFEHKENKNATEKEDVKITELGYDLLRIKKK